MVKRPRTRYNASRRTDIAIWNKIFADHINGPITRESIISELNKEGDLKDSLFIDIEEDLFRADDSFSSLKKSEPDMELTLNTNPSLEDAEEMIKCYGKEFYKKCVVFSLNDIPFYIRFSKHNPNKIIEVARIGYYISAKGTSQYGKYFDEKYFEWGGTFVISARMLKDIV